MVLEFQKTTLKPLVPDEPRGTKSSENLGTEGAEGGLGNTSSRRKELSLHPHLPFLLKSFKPSE